MTFVLTPSPNTVQRPCHSLTDADHLQTTGYTGLGASKPHEVFQCPHFLQSVDQEDVCMYTVKTAILEDTSQKG